MRAAVIRLIGMVVWGLPAASALAIEQAPSPATSTVPPHWSYDGEHGPAHWGDVAPEDAVCGNVKINYETGTVALLNNGHTVQADVSDTADTISLDGATYRLAQFHFHTPSEHTVDGKYYPLEIHFVNKDAEGHVAVVGVLVQAGAENMLLAPIFSTLPATATPAGTHAGKPLQVDIAAVLPKEHEAYVYTGSLTTPPCTEGARWIVLMQPIEMSNAQIQVFKNIFRDNHRPLQKSGGREVDRESD